MRKQFTRGLALSLFFVLSFSVTSVFAETIQIHITGLNFKYDGSDIFDSTAKAGGHSDAAESDQVATIDFFKNDIKVGSLVETDNIFADLLIKNVKNISKTGGFVTTGDSTSGFGFDLLQKSGSQTNTLLSLNIKELTLSYIGGGIYVAVGGALTDSINSQNLPFGLTMSNKDQVSLLLSSGDLKNITTSGNYLNHFDAFGTSDINGQIVPEPTSVIALLSLAVSGLAIFTIRRKNA